MSCKEISNGEIINADRIDLPLKELVVYGGNESFAKISKRLSCASKTLPFRLQLLHINDTKKALDAGARAEPTLFKKDGRLLFEGLLPTEEIEMILKELL